MPLTKRIAKVATPANQPKFKEATGSKIKASSAPDQQKKKKRKQVDAEEKTAKRRKSEPRSKSESRGKDEGKDVKWTTLMHSGVLFPPEYVAHGIKMTYDGKPVDLTSDQEEVRAFSISKLLILYPLTTCNCSMMIWPEFSVARDFIVVRVQK